MSEPRGTPFERVSHFYIAVGSDGQKPPSQCVGDPYVRSAVRNRQHENPPSEFGHGR